MASARAAERTFDPARRPGGVASGRRQPCAGPVCARLVGSEAIESLGGRVPMPIHAGSRGWGLWPMQARRRRFSSSNRP